MSKSLVEVYSFSQPQSSSYNVDYSALDFGDVPLQGMLGQLAPGTSSSLHNHFEVEIFIFVSGSGVFHAAEQHIPIMHGKAVRVSPFVNHVIENTHPTETLQFISLYWSEKICDLDVHTKKDISTLIFSAPFTPNGDMHLGHLSGPYLAADIYRRYLQQSGIKALHITGRDDHQTYVAKKAAHERIPPEQLADKYFKDVCDSLRLSEIEIDIYIKPDQKGAYANFIKSAFMQLYENGCIFAKTEMAAFSADDNHYLHEAYISGDCPHCRHPCDGNACEQCGRPNTCVDLLSAYDYKNKKLPIIKPSKRLYFSLSKFSKQLEEYIKSTPMSMHALSLAQAMITDGLPDICVSHINTLGINVPVTEFENQTIYVWFELALGYLWGAWLSTKESEINLETIKKIYNDGNKRIIHFYGYDNAYYHTLLFPAIYLALGITQLPCAHIVNELLDLNDQKFSTSRNHAIWARDLLKIAPVDYIRWFLCEIRPENYRTNFTLSEFIKSINHIFPLTLSAWIEKISLVLTDKFAGIIPESGAWTAEHQQFLHFISYTQQKILNHYQTEIFSPHEIVRSLTNIAEVSLRFIKGQDACIEHESMRNYLRTSLALSLFALKVFALVSRPIIPTIANEILMALGISKDTDLSEISFIDAGTTFNIAYMPKLQTIHASEMTTALSVVV